MSEIKEAKSLRWLAIQFPLVENPKDDIEKLQSCINLYCTAAAKKIEQLTEENDKLYRLVDDKIQENKRLTEENERLRAKGKWITPTTISGRAFNVPHCSVCGGIPCGVDENTKFCPNCGAKMKGE